MRVDYDSVAPVYHQRYAAGSLPGVAAGLRRLSRRLGAAHLLELGCGTGQWLSELAAEGRLHGLDFSLGMLRQAQQRVPTTPLVRGDAARLPFPAASFDLVFCVNAFHHFDSKPGVLLEARRLLRPGGALAVAGMDPHLGSGAWYLYHYFEGTLETDLRRFSPGGTIIDWMMEAGFERVEWEVVHVVQKIFAGRDVLSDPFLPKHSTSQLVLLTDQAYAAGLRRIEADLARAEAAGEVLHFTVDIPLTLISGYVKSER